MKKVPKIFAVFFAMSFLGTWCLAEDLKIPHRFFELGFGVDASATNNILPIPDTLKKNLVIDLRKISEKLTNSGFVTTENTDVTALFMNVNLRNGLQIGFKAGVENGVNLKIGKSLMKAIGEGFDGGFDADAGGYADVFAYASLTGSFKLKNQMRFTIVPSLVAPIFHADLSDMAASVYTDMSGKIITKINGKANIYSSVIDASKIFDGNFLFDANAVGKSFGFDLGLGFEMPFPNYEKVQLGAYARIPIVPGTLKYGVSGDINWEYDSTLTEIFKGNMGDFQDFKFNTSDSTSGLKISRPLRLGVEGMYRPFGSWFEAYSLIGMGMRYPYTKSIKVYPEYSFSAAVNHKQIVGAKFSTSYFNQIFIQELAFMVNAKVFELNLAISMQSENFVKSFQAAGLGVKLYMTFGVPIFEKREKTKKEKYQIDGTGSIAIGGAAVLGVEGEPIKDENNSAATGNVPSSEERGKNKKNQVDGSGSIVIE